MIAGLLAVAIVGAFQLCSAAALSEKGFLSLMGMALQRLPLVVGKALELRSLGEPVAPPERGINNLSVDYEYVKLTS